MGPNLGGFKGNRPDDSIENADLDDRINEIAENKANRFDNVVERYNTEMPSLISERRRCLEALNSQAEGFVATFTEGISGELRALLERSKDSENIGRPSRESLSKLYSNLVKAFYEDFQASEFIKQHPEVDHHRVPSTATGLADDDMVYSYYNGDTDNNHGSFGLYYEPKEVLELTNYARPSNRSLEAYEESQYIKDVNVSKVENDLNTMHSNVDYYKSLLAWGADMKDDMKRRIKAQFIERLYGLVARDQNLPKEQAKLLFGITENLKKKSISRAQLLQILEDQGPALAFEGLDDGTFEFGVLRQLALDCSSLAVELVPESGSKLAKGALTTAHDFARGKVGRKRMLMAWGAIATQAEEYDDKIRSGYHATLAVAKAVDPSDVGEYNGKEAAKGAFAEVLLAHFDAGVERWAREHGQKWLIEKDAQDKKIEKLRPSNWHPGYRDWTTEAGAEMIAQAGEGIHLNLRFGAEKEAREMGHIAKLEVEAKMGKMLEKLLQE